MRPRCTPRSAGYVANHDRVLTSTAATQSVLNAVSPLFLEQGAAVRGPASPFAGYLASGDLSAGARKVPMVITDEAQFVASAAAGRIHPDMVLMYPDPGIQLQQTVLAFRRERRRDRQTRHDRPGSATTRGSARLPHRRAPAVCRGGGRDPGARRADDPTRDRSAQL